MSQEIVDAVRELERDKGIDSALLLSALEDALLAAYKKTPGASRHATSGTCGAEIRSRRMNTPRRACSFLSG